MTTWVGLLRAVNVGGRSLPMERLRAVVSGLGHERVRTYVQSGNLVFDAAGKPATIARGIEAALAAETGVETTVLLRKADEMAAVAEGSPFLAVGADPKALHVTFLAAEPEAERVAAVAAPAGESGEWVVAGREVYLHVPGGYGRTKLNNSFFERRLGVAATSRNWRSVLALRDLAAAAA